MAYFVAKANQFSPNKWRLIIYERRIYGNRDFFPERCSLRLFSSFNRHCHLSVFDDLP